MLMSTRMSLQSSKIWGKKLNWVEKTREALNEPF
jgi:hypothetical protein